MKDILDNRTFHFINNDVMIDFELSPTLNDLINKAENADLYDYLSCEPSAINAFRGEYMTNYSEWSNNAFDAFYK